MVNYYEILGISSSSTKNDVKSAFKRLALKFHPDKNLGSKLAEEQFKNINEAYQTLSNDAKRANYDLRLEYYLFLKQQTNSTPRVPTDASRTYYQTPPDRATNYSTQGKYYTEPSAKKEKQSDYYVIGITLFIVIATGSLLFGFLMNRIAAKDHYETAVYKYKSEDYSHAVRELNKALEFNDRFAEAYELRADIMVRFEDYESALPDYNLAIDNYDIPPKSLFMKRDFCRKLIGKNKNSL